MEGLDFGLGGLSTPSRLLLLWRKAVLPLSSAKNMRMPGVGPLTWVSLSIFEVSFVRISEAFRGRRRADKKSASKTFDEAVLERGGIDRPVDKGTDDNSLDPRQNLRQVSAPLHAVRTRQEAHLAVVPLLYPLCHKAQARRAVRE